MDLCEELVFFIHLFMFIVYLTAPFVNLIYVNWIRRLVTE